MRFVDFGGCSPLVGPVSVAEVGIRIRRRDVARHALHPLDEEIHVNGLAVQCAIEIYRV